MLLQLSVENYKSIDERITLSMLATKEPHHMSYVHHIGDFEILPTALIVGPNGAGKSNLFQALRVLQGFCKGKYSVPLPYRPHRKEEQKETRIHLQMVVHEDHYAYGLSYNRERITGEYLVKLNDEEEMVLFEREEDEIYYEGKKEDVPFHLSALRRLKDMSAIEPIFTYLTKDLLVVLTGQDQDFYDDTIEFLKREDHCETVGRLLSRLNIGVRGLAVGAEGILVRYEHIEIPLSEESTGTKRMIMLLSLISGVLNEGKTVVIDELERNLHTIITTTIVKLFHTENINLSHAQLICSSHNTHLLDLNLFRQDQIWFMEKDLRTLQTELYSLYNIADVLEDENIEFGYVEGKYGATFKINFAEVLKDEE